MFSSSLNNALTRANKQEVAGWGMPDYSAGVSFTVPFTAPEDGYIYACGNPVNGDPTILYVNGVEVYYWFHSNGYIMTSGDIVPVAKGDVVTKSRDFRVLEFFPVKGVK